MRSGVSRLALIAFLALPAQALAQVPGELVEPIKIQKAAQELTLYVRAGDVCGFKNHPGAALYYGFLRVANKEAAELGIESANLMVDGMLARYGKQRMCSEAATGRPGMERLLDQLR
jgi:hypothetical protein